MKTLLKEYERHLRKCKKNGFYFRNLSGFFINFTNSVLYDTKEQAVDFTACFEYHFLYLILMENVVFHAVYLHYHISLCTLFKEFQMFFVCDNTDEYQYFISTKTDFF